MTLDERVEEALMDNQCDDCRMFGHYEGCDDCEEKLRKIIKDQQARIKELEEGCDKCLDALQQASDIVWMDNHQTMWEYLTELLLDNTNQLEIPLPNPPKEK